METVQHVGNITGGIRRRVLALVGIIALLTAFGLASAPGARAATVPGDAWVRAAHLVPGLAGMDVVVRGAAGTAPVELAANAVYGDVAPYQRLAPGTYSAELRPAGAPADSAPVLSGTFDAEAGKAYTLAGLGSLDSPRLATLQDDLTPPPAGDVRVRVLPAAGGAAQVTVAAQNGPVIADGAVFGQPTAYADVPAGSWTLDVSAAGLPSATTAVDLAAGGVYTVVVVDDGGTLDVRAVTDAAGMAAMPVGGAQTGGGGTAQAASSPSPWAPGAPASTVTVTALGALVLSLVVRRRVRSRV